MHGLCAKPKAQNKDWRFTSLAVSSGHVCGILKSGSVECWGSSPEGQANPPAGKFIRLCAGEAFTCGIRQDGQLLCWGDAPLSFDPRNDDNVLEVEELKHVDDLVCGGHVMCMQIHGEAGYQCDNGGFMKILGLLSQHVSLASLHIGRFAACGLEPNGRVQCDQVDANASAMRLKPFPFGEKPVEAISVGVEHVCALSAAGSECVQGEDHAWGFTSQSEAKPQQIVSGWSFACALAQDGTASCWGDRRTADPWSGNFVQVKHPAPPGAFKELGASGNLVCGLRPDGRAECW